MTLMMTKKDVDSNHAARISRVAPRFLWPAIAVTIVAAIAIAAAPAKLHGQDNNANGAERQWRLCDWLVGRSALFR